jgi:hypothetical protein
MTRGEDDEITDIVITPPAYRGSGCRLMVSSGFDWEDHLPDCFASAGETGESRHPRLS